MKDRLSSFNPLVVVVQLLSCVQLFGPHELQHARLPCPSVSPRVCTNSWPLSQCCHPAISSSVAPFSSCLQSFPASGSFPVSQLFASGGQVLELQHQSFQWIFRVDFLSDWLDLLAVLGPLKSLLQHHSSKASILWRSAFFVVQLVIYFHTLTASGRFLC